MNRLVKGFIITGTALAVLIIIAVLVIFHQLPSAKTIAGFVAAKKKTTDKSFSAKIDDLKAADKASAPTINTNETTKSAVRDSHINSAEKSIINENILQDLMSADQPLSDFCRTIAKSKSGTIPAKDFNKLFSKSFESDSADPRIQAAKPMLRFVFRLPKMQVLMNGLQVVAARNDESFADKAQFYSSAYGAFIEMKQHQQDIESILDRSYLFLGLNNLIAKRPELVTDSRVQNFCGVTEIAFNQNAPVDFQNEKNNFLNLLKDTGTNPKDIGFNPNYKSNITFSLEGQSLTFSGGWLDDLIEPEMSAPAGATKAATGP